MGGDFALRRHTPCFSTDYPRTLTAHDIGLKDLLDAFCLFDSVPGVVLFAVLIVDGFCGGARVGGRDDYEVVNRLN